MTKLTTLTLMGGLLLLFFCSTDVAGTSRRHRAEESGRNSQDMIGAIKDESVEDNCGCRFGYPLKANASYPAYVLLINNDLKTAWINIDGQDVKLKLAHSTSLRVAKVGSRFRSTYLADKIRVRVLFTITRVCLPSPQYCEMTGYNARITVTKEGRRQKVKAKGACGCY